MHFTEMILVILLNEGLVATSNSSLIVIYLKFRISFKVFLECISHYQGSKTNLNQAEKTVATLSKTFLSNLDCPT